MLNDVAKEWVKALRSGDYAQGRGALRDVADKFCCLGVLCDLAVEAGIIDAPIVEGGLYVYDRELAGVPAKVQEWSGVRTGVGHITDGTVPSLAVSNDRGASFSEIANLIESEPSGLFA